MLIATLTLVIGSQVLPMFHTLPQQTSPSVDIVSSIFATSLASLIKLPPPKEELPSLPTYDNLNCSEQDRNNIGYIIKTMADHGYVSLLLKSRELKKKGSEIEHVHPFKFLGTVFSNPILKTSMQKIYTESMKWKNLMDPETGLVGSLERQHNRAQLDIYLTDFAREVGHEEISLKSFIDLHDWEGLVLFLMQP